MKLGNQGKSQKSVKHAATCMRHPMLTARGNIKRYINETQCSNYITTVICFRVNAGALFDRGFLQRQFCGEKIRQKCFITDRKDTRNSKIPLKNGA